MPHRPQTRNSHPPVLARSEWDLCAHAKGVSDWQLLPMLHYEYARCYRPVIQAVKLLRQAEAQHSIKSSPVLQIAKDLALNYPEFPDKPWVLVNKQRRAERLGNIGITKEFNFYPQAPAWQTWEFFDPDAIRLREELVQLDAESYGFFKLDFSHDDPAIQKQFAKWLADRRRELMRKYDKPTKLALPRPLKGGFHINANEAFVPRKTPNPKGRGHNKRKCQDFLKALGGLRVFRHYGGDFSKAEEATALDGDDSLYDGEAAWHRAEIQAGLIMAPLAIAWTTNGLDFDIFDWYGRRELMIPEELKKRIPTSDSGAQRNFNEVRTFLQTHFDLTSMSVESPKQ